MRIAIVADSFPPMRTSGAVQLRDLASEFVRQGHYPTVIVPFADMPILWSWEEVSGVEVLRVKAPRTKDIGYAKRTFAEFITPLFACRGLKRSPLSETVWDGVVSYSPSIFLGPIVNQIRRASRCRSYLILRDIFPEWAVDMGLMGRGPPYWFFKAVEHYQYSVADVIGVQTPANLEYFGDCAKRRGRRIEVLQNWLAVAPITACSISIADTPLRGRKIFVYAGNMGAAQGMSVMLDLAEILKERCDIGFLFVGRGSDAVRLREQATVRKLDNAVFFDEIDPAEIPGLYEQCHVGLVALDSRHKTHNIPGKFVSYMQSGLPVLACINPGNDLERLIDEEQVGRVCTEPSAVKLASLARSLIGEMSDKPEIRSRCKAVGATYYSPEVAVKQIVRGLLS